MSGALEQLQRRMAAAVMQLPTVTADRSAATLSVIVVESV